MKKVFYILLIIIISLSIFLKRNFIASLWKSLTSSEDENKSTKQEEIPEYVSAKRGKISVFVEATGRVVPEQEVEIKCKASGEIIKLPVDLSDRVEKGALLVQLDPEDEERSVKRAEVDLAVSKARLSQAKIDLKVAENEYETERSRAEAAIKSVEASVSESKAKLERVEQLLEKKMASREEYDGVQTAYAQALADLENARARMEGLKVFEVKIDSRHQDVKIAEAQLESDKISLSDSKQRLSDTTVLAPIDGVVVEKNVQVGQIIASGINNVGGGTTILKLADLSHIYVLVSVDESDIGNITVGQNADITVDAYPDIIFPGMVVRVATKGTIVSNVVTFEVKVEVTGEDKNLLKPEMTANVEITAVEKEDILILPVSVIKRRKRDSYVIVKKPDGTQEERMINTGVTDGEFIEVLNGLKEGDEVYLPGLGEASRWRKENGEERQGSTAREDRMRMRMIGRTLNR